MKLTIIPIDKKVGVDGLFLKFDLSACVIPANIHALQWYDTEGEVEFINNPDRTKPQNKLISELPVWANACVTKWSESKVAQADAIAKAEACRLANQPSTNIQTA